MYVVKLREKLVVGEKVMADPGSQDVSRTNISTARYRKFNSWFRPIHEVFNE